MCYNWFIFQKENIKAMAKQKYRFVDVNAVGSLMYLLLGINILGMHEGC